MVRDRILLIDEDPNLLTCVKTLLEEKNFEVETAQDRNQGLSHLSRKSFSVLITEYLLQHLDTRDIIHRVKTTSPETYIIVVTGAIIDDITHEELVDLGVSDLFIKPYPIESMVIAVKKALRTRQMALGFKRLRKQLHATRTRFREAREGYLLDPLTASPECQIYNDRYLRDRFNRELKRARRHDRYLSLLLLSLTSPQKAKGLDPRKTDQYLIEMAKVVRKNIRAEDTVARRHQGFALILPETASKGMDSVKNRLAGLIQTHSPFLSDPQFQRLNRKLSFASYSYPEELEIPTLD
ncbi:MAG: response regulator, partial [Proteobacteria bacterium]|nr:response regulator [Pseudomonadota bacterium]